MSRLGFYTGRSGWAHRWVSANQRATSEPPGQSEARYSSLKMFRRSSRRAAARTAPCGATWTSGRCGAPTRDADVLCHVSCVMCHVSCVMWSTYTWCSDDLLNIGSHWSIVELFKTFFRGFHYLLVQVFVAHVESEISFLWYSIWYSVNVCESRELSISTSDNY